LLADSFQVGEKNLIVEGISDHMIIAGFSQALAECNSEHLDLNVISIYPADGADKVANWVAFSIAEQVPYVVVFDSDEKGVAARKNIIDGGLADEQQIVMVGDSVKPGAGAHLEDLVPIDLYLRAVNAAYSRTLGAKFKGVDADSLFPDQKNTRSIIAALKEHFTAKKYGGFDKVLVAKELVNSLTRDDLMDGASLKEGLRPLADLLKRLNQAVPKAEKLLRRRISEA